MSARLFFLQPGRLVTHDELYGVAVDLVPDARPVAAPVEVEIHEVSDNAQYLRDIGFNFAGLELGDGVA